MADLKENALFAFLDAVAVTATHRERLDALKKAFDRPSDAQLALDEEAERAVAAAEAAAAQRVADNIAAKEARKVALAEAVDAAKAAQQQADALKAAVAADIAATGKISADA